MEFKCKLCKDVKNGESLPYGWSSVHEEASGVHDSASVTFDYDYYLCRKCRIKIADLEIE